MSWTNQTKNSYVTYLVDENGNYITTESGDYIIVDDSIYFWSRQVKNTASYTNQTKNS